MNPLATSSIVFACLVVGTSSGLLLRTVLPPHHLSEQSKDTIKLTAGLIGTMVALILGLLVASGKSFFDTQSAELAQSAAQVVMLDHILWARNEASARYPLFKHGPHSRTTMVTVYSQAEACATILPHLTCGKM
jgi:hypothetical protein